MYVSHENANTYNDYAIGERQNGSYIIRVTEIYRVYRLVLYYYHHIMRDIFLIRITAQLMIIWVLAVMIENSIGNDTYECLTQEEYKEGVSPVFWAVFPLIAFTNGNLSEEIDKYCKRID